MNIVECYAIPTTPTINLCSRYWYTHNLVMIDIDWGVRILHISLNDEQVNQIRSISQP